VTRFTPLESDILDALAWDLRDIAPDLAGQFAESLPAARRNTGAGLFTELIVDRSRPPPMTTPTGRFGTVHAMVGDLPDPIAFQVELRQGRLLALHGDAYGQDTRAIDFARVPFDQVFTLDDRGESIAFDPEALMQPSPLLDLHQHADHEPSLPVAAAPPVSIAAVQQFQNEKLQGLVDVMFGTVRPATATPVDEEAPVNKADQTSLRIGLWVAIAVGSLLITLVMRLPIFFAIFLTFAVGRMLNRPPVLSALARGTRRLGQYEYRPPER
jgi:hypothetical protein